MKNLKSLLLFSVTNLKEEIKYDLAKAGDEGEIAKIISICLYLTEK